MSVCHGDTPIGCPYGLDKPCQRPDAPRFVESQMAFGDYRWPGFIWMIAVGGGVCA
jgi:hypothetical protein